MVRVISGSVVVENRFGSETLNAEEIVLCDENQKPIKQSKDLIKFRELLKNICDKDQKIRGDIWNEIIRLVEDRVKAKRDTNIFIEEVNNTIKNSSDEKYKTHLEVLLYYLKRVEKK